MHPHSFATCHCVGLPLAHSCLPGRTAPLFTLLRPPQKGQLGLGDAINRNNPTIVPGLRGKKVVGGSAGRNHSAVITATGESYTFGLNQYGQLGTGSVKKVKSGEDTALTPQLVSPAGGMGCDAAQSARCMALGTPAGILSRDTSAHCWRSTSFTLPPPLCQAVVSKCSKVGCGVDFTMWLCDGKVWSAGCPQYGQLGHGTDNSYNAGGWPQRSSTMGAACGGTVGLQEGGGTFAALQEGNTALWPRFMGPTHCRVRPSLPPAADSSVKMVFEPQPQPRIIAALSEKTVTQVGWAWAVVKAGRRSARAAPSMKPCAAELLHLCWLCSALPLHCPPQLAVGYNHTIAVASDGGVWTWGFGGYGRLGHKVQQVGLRGPGGPAGGKHSWAHHECLLGCWASALDQDPPNSGHALTNCSRAHSAPPHAGRVPPSPGGGAGWAHPGAR
jgi:hypothetical protein